MIQYRKKLRYFSILLLLNVTLQAQSILSTDQIEYLNHHDEIVFTGQKYYPPFEYINEQGEYTGIAVELIRWMGVELGFRPVFLPLEFSMAQQAILNGEADVLTSFFHSIEREKQYDFTDLLYEVPASIYILNERTDINRYQDLLNKRVAMQRGDYAAEYLIGRGYKGHMVFTEDFGKATQTVIGGMTDALIGDEQIVDYYRYKNNIYSEIKKIGEPLYVGQCAMAVAEGEDSLIAILNTGIRHAKQSGILDRLTRRWLGVNESGVRKFWLMNRTKILGFIIVISIVMLNMFYVNMRLRHKIKIREQELELSYHQNEKTRTEKLKITEDLVRSQDNWIQIFNSLPEAIIVYDPRNKVIIDMNPATLNMFQMSKEEIIQAGILELTAGIKDFTKEDFKINADRARSGEMVSFEWLIKRKDGSLLWTDISITNTFLDTEPRMLAVLRDVSDRKQTESELTRAELLFANLISQSREALILNKSDGTIISFNTAAERITGISASDALNQPVWEILPHILPGNDKRVVKVHRLENVIRDMIKDPAGKISRYTGKWQGRDMDLYYTAMIYPITIPNDTVVTISIRDITSETQSEIERNQIMANARNRERFELAGLLAGGVAHEINNPLTGITNYAQLISDRESDPILKTFSEGIITEAGKAANIIKSLLKFARQDETIRENVSLSEIIADVMNLSRNLLKRDTITLDNRIEESLPLIRTRGNQLNQVLFNLIMNARDALNEKYPGFDDRKKITIDGSVIQLKNQEMIELRVRDEGIGIPAENLHKIFEPFFTTKKLQKSTGLGLSIAYHMILEHDGDLLVDSKAGEYTIFMIRLPVI